MDEIALYLEEAKESMEKTLQHTKIELSKIRAGKANPAILDGIKVEYYGSMTPISQVASITTPDVRTIVIKPWEKNMIPIIEKAIKESELRLNPQNDGEVIRIILPPLTEDRRRDLVKQAKGECEQGKVAVRNIRKETNEGLRKLIKEGVAEDVVKAAEEKVQKLTDTYVAKIDELLAVKEKDIMTI
ncbi:MAG: ribosome recycling factor [Cytophagales bacterium]|nr:ribosome recycling factor [Cytophagales bacterium]MDW8385279.1 ribosome recycling factor [Flammeovirgaceae bacterium]